MPLCRTWGIAALTAAAIGCASGGGGARNRDGGAPPPPADAGRDAREPPTLEDGGTPPTAEDGGTRPTVDSGPGPACTSAADCSDGLACNGVERCELGRCVAGTPLRCDDGVPCTADACEEPGTCRYTPMDSLCPAGQRCGATGCTSSGACSESPCRLISPQCGCPSGQACYLAGGSMRACATAGAGAEGTACTSSSSCAPGLDCVNLSVVASRSITQCARYCGTDSDCMGAGSLCLHALDDGMGGAIPGVRICTRACNPVRQTGCATGLMCNVYRESIGSMRFLTDCTGPAGTRTRGQSCTQDIDCAPGLACISSRCYRWCDVATNEGCLGAELCSPLTPRAVVGGTEYGVCV
jgi:hypothetical protein